MIQTAKEKQGVIKSLVNQFIPMFNNDTPASNKSPILVNTSNYSPELDATGQDIEIDENTVMGIPAFKSAMDLIVGTVGSLPIELFQPDTGSVPKKIADDYRLQLLNNEANAQMSSYNLKRKIVKDLLLYGQSLTYIERSSNDDPNQVTSLYPLNTKDITINVYTANGYSYYPEVVYTTNAGIFNYDNENLINILGDSDDGIIGQGVIEKNADTLRLAINQRNFEKNLLGNGAIPASTLTSDKKVTNEVMSRLKSQFSSLYSGPKNVGKTVILENGMVYKQLSTNPDNLQLSDSKTAMLGEIARMFNIPETLINASANKYNSNEQNNIQFFQYCLRPILTSVESALDQSLLLESEKAEGYAFKFNTDSVFQNTLQDKVTAIGTLFNQGLMSYEEARHQFKLPNLVSEDFIKLTLGAVIFYPKTGQMIVPNTYGNEQQSSDEDTTQTSPNGATIPVATSTNKTSQVNAENQIQSHVKKVQNNLTGGGKSG